jgi:hypothetical protein
MSRRSGSRLLIGLGIFAAVALLAWHYSGSLFDTMRSLHGGG